MALLGQQIEAREGATHTRNDGGAMSRGMYRAGARQYAGTEVEISLILNFSYGFIPLGRLQLVHCCAAVPPGVRDHAPHHVARNHQEVHGELPPQYPPDGYACEHSGGIVHRLPGSQRHSRPQQPVLRKYYFRTEARLTTDTLPSP